MSGHSFAIISLPSWQYSWPSFPVGQPNASIQVKVCGACQSSICGSKHPSSYIHRPQFHIGAATTAASAGIERIPQFKLWDIGKAQPNSPTSDSIPLIWPRYHPSWLFALCD